MKRKTVPNLSSIEGILAYRLQPQLLRIEEIQQKVELLQDELHGFQARGLNEVRALRDEFRGGVDRLSQFLTRLDVKIDHAPPKREMRAKRQMKAKRK